MITEDIKDNLDFDSETDRFNITSIELRGLIANAITKTSSQCALDIGRALAIAPTVSAQFTTPAVETDLSAYGQPTLQQELNA